MTTRRPVQHKLVGKLTVDTEFGTFLGDTRIRLLEAIDRYGSISQAAKAVPLSYKAAWDAVDAMNNLAEAPLVERSVGGKHGGGTRLTDYGRRVIAMYRAVEQEYQQAIDRLSSRLGEGGETNVRQFQTLLRRMAMRTSARNQFVGTVSGLREGEVSFEVRVRLDDANEVVAVITRASAENLELGIGSEVHAFVKAPSVLIITDPHTPHHCPQSPVGRGHRHSRGAGEFRSDNHPAQRPQHHLGGDPRQHRQPGSPSGQRGLRGVPGHLGDPRRL
jgi:molybdate transport system regulatory protein